MGHMSALEPTSEVGHGLKLRERVSVGALLGEEAGSRALGHVALSKPSLSREAGFGATRHVAARGCMSFPLSWLKAYTRGYRVCMVPTN
jgi:hypothetical protein